jgi:hypothetical protein
MYLQLAILTDRMVLAVSIKEGAEAMLHGNPEGLTVLIFNILYSVIMIDAQEALREQVQSELDTAKGVIETISHMLEQRVSTSTMFTIVRIDFISRKTAEWWMIKVDLPALMSSN